MDIDTISKLVSSLGLPLTLIVLAIVFFWSTWKWIRPKIDNVIQAHIDRQRQTADSMTLLTSKTIEIQESNKEAIEKIPAMVESLLRTQPLPVILSVEGQPQKATVHVATIPKIPGT